jgi:NAD(P)H-hydrate epimerase
MWNHQIVNQGCAGTGHGFLELRASSIPTVTAEQMRKVDRVAMGEYGLLLIQMMENAGLHLADLAIRRFRPRAVAVRCGRGGNGGGGLVAARHPRQTPTPSQSRPRTPTRGRAPMPPR